MLSPVEVQTAFNPSFPLSRESRGTVREEGKAGMGALGVRPELVKEPLHRHSLRFAQVVAEEVAVPIHVKKSNQVPPLRWAPIAARLAQNDWYD